MIACGRRSGLFVPGKKAEYRITSPAWRGKVMRIPLSVGANTKVTPLRTMAPAPVRHPPLTSTAPSERICIESP